MQPFSSDTWNTAQGEQNVASHGCSNTTGCHLIVHLCHDSGTWMFDPPNIVFLHTVNQLINVCIRFSSYENRTLATGAISCRSLLSSPASPFRNQRAKRHCVRQIRALLYRLTQMFVSRRATHAHWSTTDLPRLILFSLDWNFCHS